MHTKNPLHKKKPLQSSTPRREGWVGTNAESSHYVQSHSVIPFMNNTDWWVILNSQIHLELYLWWLRLFLLFVLLAPGCLERFEQSTADANQDCHM